MAERAGFEPAVEFDPYDGLANRSFRPLRHLSAYILELYSIIRFLQPEIPVFFIFFQFRPQKSHKNMKMPLLKAILCVEEYRFEKAFLSDFAFEVQMLPKSNCI